MVKEILISIIKVLTLTTIDGIKDATIIVYIVKATTKEASDTFKGFF